MEDTKQETVHWESKASEVKLDVPRPLYDALKNLAEVAATGNDEKDKAMNYDALMDMLFHVVGSSACAFVTVNEEGSFVYKGMCEAAPDRVAEIEKEKEKEKEPGHMVVSAVGMHARNLKDHIAALASTSKSLYPRVMEAAMAMDPKGAMNLLMKESPLSAIAYATKHGLTDLMGSPEECDCPDCQARREEEKSEGAENASCEKQAAADTVDDGGNEENTE